MSFMCKHFVYNGKKLQQIRILIGWYVAYRYGCFNEFFVSY